MFASKDLFFTRPSGYQISRSVRLRSSASAYFNRTPASAGSQTTWTMSMWVKRGALGVRQFITMSGTNPNSSQVWQVEFDANNKLDFYNQTIGTYRRTTQVFRDSSAWYHIVFGADTNNATAQNRFRCWVNGVEVTAWDVNSTISSGYTFAYNGAYLHGIGAYTYSGNGLPLDGYLTEVNFIDGQALTPSSFGSTNSVTGVWQPKKYAGTYGTNGFYLNFSDNSNNTATTIGKDYSGNGNNWTPNNISVTAGTTYDSMIDVPTNYADGSTGRGNYATLNPLDKTPASTTITASNGNLQVTSTNAGTVAECMAATIAIPANSGKWYWECQFTTENDAVGTPNTGIIDASLQITSDCYLGSASAPASIGFSCDGQIRTPTGNTSYTNPTSSQVVGFAYDSSNGKLWVAVAGTWQNSGDPAAGTGQVATASWYANGAKVANSSNRSLVTVFNFGQRPFSYTPPTGFKALNTQNLPDATIPNGSKQFDVSLWTGTGTNPRTLSTGIAFQPDLVWVKARSAGVSHALHDAVRGFGVSTGLASNLTGAEGANAVNGGVTAVGVGSLTLNAGSTDAANVNNSTVTYAGWQWNAGGNTVSNTSGSITSQVRANPTAGISVVTYTGTGANATVGHGLGVAPSMVIVKSRNSANNWPVWHSAIAGTQFMLLNLTDAVGTAANVWNSTTPSSSVFSVGTNVGTNSASTTYVAYCFAPIAGYSAFGSYTGNGSADGPFVFTNFQPRWVMVKRTDSTSDWYIWDTSRDTYNVESATLLADTSGAETSATSIDGLSNGFKCRSATVVNASGGTYIYAAFASSPFKLSLAR